MSSYGGRKLQGPGRRPTSRSKGGKKKSSVVNYGQADSSRNLNSIHNSFSPTAKSLNGSTILDTEATSPSFQSPLSASLSNHSSLNNHTNSKINNNNTNNNGNKSDSIIKDEQLRKPSEIRKMQQANANNNNNNNTHWANRSGASYSNSVSNSNSRSNTVAVSNASRNRSNNNTTTSTKSKTIIRPKSPPPKTALPGPPQPSSSNGSSLRRGAVGTQGRSHAATTINSTQNKNNNNNNKNNNSNYNQSNYSSNSSNNNNNNSNNTRSNNNMSITVNNQSNSNSNSNQTQSIQTRNHATTAIEPWSMGGRRDRGLAIRVNTSNLSNASSNSSNSSNTIVTFSPASQSSSLNNSPVTLTNNGSNNSTKNNNSNNNNSNNSSNNKKSYAAVAATTNTPHSNNKYTLNTDNNSNNYKNNGYKSSKQELSSNDSVHSDSASPVPRGGSKRNNNNNNNSRKGSSNSSGTKKSDPYLSKPLPNLVAFGNYSNSSHGSGHSHGSSSIGSKKDHQIVGEILMHYDSWQQLLTGKNNVRSTRRWKSVFAVLEDHSVRFWEQGARASQVSDITIFLSEIVGINKSIRTIDNEKHIIDIDLCGSKCHLAFQNHELREFWYGKLNNYYWDYFMWRSAPLDPKHRRSQNTVIGFHKVITNQSLTAEEAAGVEYVDEVLHKVNVLPKDVYNRVPPDCVAQARRFQRALMAVRYFLMSALKSVSGADVPLPSLDNLTEFLNEIQLFKWEQASVESLDYLTDRLYRLQINLSFALTAVCRDEIMRLREYTANNGNNNNNNSLNNMNSMPTTSNERKLLTELRYEYECLQRSWKMHRERLQEYVAAYGDAVARLKYSYHKRDQLCKKIEQLSGDKKELENSHSQYEQQLQKLTETIPLLYNSLNQATPSTTRSATNGVSANDAFKAHKNSNTVGGVSPLPTKLVIDIPQPSMAEFQLGGASNNGNNGNNNSKRLSTTSSNHSKTSLSQSHAQQQQYEMQKQLRIQKLSLDLIRLKAEQETHQLLHPNDPKPAYMTAQIKNLQEQIATLQNNDSPSPGMPNKDDLPDINENRDTNNDKINNINNINNMNNINNGNNNGHTHTINIEDTGLGVHHERQVSKQTQLVGLLEQQVKSLVNMAQQQQPQSSYSRQQHWDFM